MKSKPSVLSSGVLLFLVFAGSVGAQEGITRDPTSGDYTITYQQYDDNGNSRLAQNVFVPKTKVEPTIDSSLKWIDKNSILYRYVVSNGAGAKQDVHMIIFDPVRTVLTSQNMSVPSVGAKLVGQNRDSAATGISTPKSWYASIANSKVAAGARIGWTYQSTGGIPPAGEQRDFGLNSRDLPGIVLAAVSGNAPPGQGLGEQAPDPDSTFGKQYKELVTRNYVAIPVAVPTIPVSTSSNLSDIVRAIQAHVKTWPSEKVLDQGSVAQIDLALEQVARALQANNADAARAELKSTRKLLKNLEPMGGQVPKGKPNAGGMKLVKDVLTFDIRYLAKALNNGQEGADDE